MKTIDTEEIQNQLTQEVNKQIIDAIISYGTSAMDKIIYKTHKTKPVDEPYIYLPLPDVPLVGNYANPKLMTKGRYYCETQPYGGVCLESYYVSFISMGVCCNA